MSLYRRSYKMLKKDDRSTYKRDLWTEFSSRGFTDVPGEGSETKHAAEAAIESREGMTISLMNPMLVSELIIENRHLQSKISELVDVLKELINTISEPKPSEEQIIEIREIPRHQAKKEIAELFQKSETLYFSDIAEKLCLDLELVVELCAELQKEGKIKLKD